MTYSETTRQRPTSTAVFFGLALALAACNSRAADPSATARVDSAGIPITTALAPVWGPGDEWTVVETSLVQIGSADGPAEYLLGSLARAVRLGNGDIVLGDWSNNVLRRYDGEGVFVWEASRPGEGPGEHQEVTATTGGRVRRVWRAGRGVGSPRSLSTTAPWTA